MDIDFEKFDHRDAKHEVVQVTVAAAPTNLEVNQPKTGAHLVHWRIHLHWRNKNGEVSKATVMLDTQKLSAEDPIVEIKVRSKRTMFSAKAIQTWHWAFAMKVDGVTVEDFVDLILENERPHYTYDANGSGCLFWTKTLIQDFADAGWIEEGEPAKLAEYVLEVRNAYEGPNKP